MRLVGTALAALNLTAPNGAADSAVAGQPETSIAAFDTHCFNVGQSEANARRNMNTLGLGAKEAG